MKTAYCPDGHTQLAEVSVGKLFGHVPGHQYHDVDVVISKADDRYRIHACESWGSCQGHDEEQGRNELIASRYALNSAQASVLRCAVDAGIKDEGREYLVQALSQAIDLAIEREVLLTRQVAVDGTAGIARDIVARLRNYDACHDGDVDQAADMIELLLKQLPGASLAEHDDNATTMRAFKMTLLVTIDDVAAVAEEYREADQGPVTLDELRDYLRGAMRIDVDIENHINEVGWQSAEVVFDELQELTADERKVRYPIH